MFTQCITSQVTALALGAGLQLAVQIEARGKVPLICIATQSGRGLGGPLEWLTLEIMPCNCFWDGGEGV